MRLPSLDKSSDTPLNQQLYTHLRNQILSGALPQAERLPASRKLAQQLGVGRITVMMAYEQLEQEGYIVSRTGSGTFVTDNLPTPTTTKPQAPKLSRWAETVLETEPSRATAPKRGGIDFGMGRTDPTLFPFDVWRKLLARYLSTDDTLLSRYGSAAGFMPLREAIASYLAQWRGVRCAPEQVVIVNGVQEAIDLLARLLISPKDEVLMESPGFPDAVRLFRLHGATVRPIPVDDHGFCVDQLPTKSRAKLAFVTPANQFPRGGALPLARRLALLDWANKANCYLIEDDYIGELRYEGRPLSALQSLDESGRVIYLGTFTTVLFPALRVSYIVLPPSLMTPFIQAKGVLGRGSPTLTQAAVSDFISEGHFERHLKKLRKAYGTRWRTLTQMLDQQLPSNVRYVKEPSGLHVMLQLADGMDEDRLIRDVSEQGVTVYSGKQFDWSNKGENGLILGFSGLSESEIEAGVKTLVRAL